MKDKKTEFVELLRSTKRKGVQGVIDALDSLGFFAAPASANHHLNVEGGLLEHSLNVCNMALSIRETLINKDEYLRLALPRESVIIAALLHDVCKSDIYKPSEKNVKNDMGIWESLPCYIVTYEHFPLGHGEKSVIMLMRCGLDLTDDEILAIRWHMNAWEIPFQSPEARNSYNVAKFRCPLISLIQAADGLSAGILEATYYK